MHGETVKFTSFVSCDFIFFHIGVINYYVLVHFVSVALSKCFVTFRWKVLPSSLEVQRPSNKTSMSKKKFFINF
jgi:hypothetical protein